MFRGKYSLLILVCNIITWSRNYNKYSSNSTQ